MDLKKRTPALVLIDFQKGFDDASYWGGNRNNPDAEVKARKILDKWRSLQLPLFHIRHSSTNPNSRLHRSKPGFDIKKVVKPINSEPVITKEVNSAFIGTNLREQLDRLEITTLVIVGLTTNHCVSTTVRMAANLGYIVYLIADATATFDRSGLNGEKYEAELLHRTSLASLNEEFATIINTDELIKRLSNDY